MKLSNEQKERLSQAFKNIMEPEVFQEFISVWQKDPEQAMAILGLESEEDVNAIDAYAKPFLPRIRELSNKQKDQLAAAFEQLLDPNTLKQFLDRRDTVGLEQAMFEQFQFTPNDVEAFHSYLNTLGFPPELRKLQEILRWTPPPFLKPPVP